MITPSMRCPYCKSFKVLKGVCTECGKTLPTQNMGKPVIEKEKKEEIPEQNINNEENKVTAAVDIENLDFSSYSLFQLEKMMDKLNIPLPDFDYDKEDLIDIISDYASGDIDDSEDDYESSATIFEDDDEDYENETSNTGELDKKMDEEDVEAISEADSSVLENDGSVQDNEDNDMLIDDEIDYAELSLAKLQKLCKEREIAITGKEKRGKLVSLLYQYDEEQVPENKEEEIDYADLDIEELKTLCDERGITYLSSYKKGKFISLLYQYDEEQVQEDEEIEDDEDAEDEEDDEVDYADLTVPRLKDLCDERGIYYSSKIKKSALIALLVSNDNEALDEESDLDQDADEEYEEEYEEVAYTDLNLSELKEICDERGIAHRSRATKAELIELLEAYDDEYDYEEENDAEEMVPEKGSLLSFVKKANKGTEPSEEMEQNIESSYDPNYDHYYDDVLPEVIANMEKIPKEAVLKAIGCVLLVFAAIVFFIYYF